MPNKFFDDEAVARTPARYNYARARLTKTMSYLVLLLILVATLLGVFVYSGVKNREICQCRDLHTSVRLKTAGHEKVRITSGYATWFTAGGAIRIAHYDVITRKL